ncbi:sigma-70 family RNA polymerase sigma factor [Corynebacterium caspium]|uniref:sigma-70 family RNA polymerase sigma factor n=1 Tax=Corynebacterium caspium TaxID=234828 RepID=UPI00036F2917|nr:sigma-70 family RNA polymerase sigma factor [Corynebacterium caspium]WKD60057.1 ECF RNA polymerase sigma factor SigM [Corynebacterium caspium DSM 44850]
MGTRGLQSQVRQPENLFWQDIRENILVAAFVAGESAAFAEIVRRHHPALERAARRYARNEQDIEDIVQDTFLRAAIGMPTFRAHAQLSTWLIRLLCNAGYDFLNHRNMREIPVLDDNRLAHIEPFWDPSEDYALRISLETGLRSINREQATSLVLIDALGYSVDYVANMHNVAPGTIKSRRFRARKNLRVHCAEASG